jgi:hypothetical protein
MPVDYAAAALAAARRYCGWHVTPAVTETITVDGPGGRVVSLPTMHLNELTEVIEDGVTLNVADLAPSVTVGTVRKRSGARWTSELGGITVTMTHGHDVAPDFDAAVEQCAAALAGAGTRTDTALKRKKVDDVEHEWFEAASSFLNTSLLDGYRILPSP